MATRSTISKRNEDGSITSIYCHWDGYLEGVGATLKECYTDPKKIDKLLELGAISFLGDDIQSTCAYVRDRNEPYLDIRHYDDVKSIEEEEYNYLFEDNVWKIINDDGTITEF